MLSPWQAQLWNLNRTYGESLRLLDETNAAVQMHNYGGCIMDFSGLDLELVISPLAPPTPNLFHFTRSFYCVAFCKLQFSVRCI